MVNEHATQGTLALVTDMASSAVTGMAGLAKAALIGRDDGYRAGAVILTLVPEAPCYTSFAPHHQCANKSC
jgi:hypothetical protein